MLDTTSGIQHLPLRPFELLLPQLLLACYCPTAFAHIRFHAQGLKRISTMTYCRRILAVLSVLALAGTITRSACANDGEAHWIWSPAQTKNDIPVGECYFRKSFDLAGAVEGAEIQVTADNEFELTVNGQPVAKGVDWRQLQVHEITNLLRKGRNTVAVRVLNKEVGSAGLA